MSKLIKMDSYLITGARIEAVQTTITVGDTTVLMHRPFIEIGNGLAITPVIKADGSSGLRIPLDVWAPMYLGLGGGNAVVVPMGAPQDQAIVAVRAFDADPAITWSASPGELVSWAQAYVAGLNAKVGERA